MSSDAVATIALSLIHGAGRATANRAARIARRQKRPLAALFGMTVETLLPLAAPGEEDAVPFISRCGAAELERAQWMIDWAVERGMRVCASGESPYPERIVEALGDQAPPVLFYVGNEGLFETPAAGIVGTRHPSMEGVAHARAAARVFAEQGIPVVSGGAPGIDREAQHGALGADGSAIVVAPEDIVSFECTAPLRAGLDAGQALIVSEFLPGAGWLTHQAMTRNRTVAAMARLLCVLEPRSRGGSMYTMGQALDMARQVFYWGGAFRDAAPPRDLGARPLLGAGNRIDVAALLRAMEAEPGGATQLEMF